ncbi:hypothetical protein Tco_0559096, partial [Tanacetum coccineum]
GNLSLKDQYPKLYALELHKDISVAEKTDSSLALSFRHPPRVGDEEEQYSHLLSRVDKCVGGVYFASLLFLLLGSANEEQSFTLARPFRF